MKGFVGPIGDDLPSLIAIMLAFTLFFAGLTFAMRTFNQKQRDITLMKGSLDISRAIIQEPVIKNLSSSEADSIADNNNLEYYTNFTEEFDRDECGEPGEEDENIIYFSFLVSREDHDGDAVLSPLRVCVWEPN